MRYFHHPEDGVYAKKTLDPQIICFEPEVKEHSRISKWIYKVEESNSGLRWILTIIESDDVDQKGYYVKTLRMGLSESIVMAKQLVGPGMPIYIPEMSFMKIPTEEYRAFNRWFNSLKTSDLKEYEKCLISNN